MEAIKRNPGKALTAIGAVGLSLLSLLPSVPSALSLPFPSTLTELPITNLLHPPKLI